jgi:hypothetical protein
MVLRKIFLLFLLIILLIPAASVSAQAPDQPGGTPAVSPQGSWEFLRWGIDWQLFHLTNPRPVDIFIARMHRVTQTATIDTAIAQGKIKEGRESVDAMVARNQGAVNYWGQTWGNRNDIPVAINGYFFDDLGGTGTPWSGVAKSGWYAKRFTDNLGDAGFAWTQDRQAFIGACVFHTGNDNEVAFQNTTYTPNIDAINAPRSDQEFIVYTPQYNSQTDADSTSLELLVEMTAPSQILPKPAGAVGTIRKITKNQGATPLYFDYVVLSFWGEKRNLIEARITNGTINVGDQISISQEITDCPSSKTGTHDWTKTYASLGGDKHFLINGNYDDPGPGDPVVNNSRTVIAYNSEFVYFVVVDGWNLNQSEGMTLAELSNFLVSQLQVTDAVTLDGGGSSTFVVYGMIINNTYCNFTRNCGIPSNEQNTAPSAPASQLETPLEYLPPVSSTEQSLGILAPEQPDCVPGDCKPQSGTAFMMVSSQPISQSLTFTPTQIVTTTASAAIRLGPGTNYASLGSVPSGTEGKVYSNLSNTNGVLAKNSAATSGLSYWWFVDMGSLTGWVVEEVLEGGNTPPEPPPIDYTDFAFLPTIPHAAVGVLAAEYGFIQGYPGPVPATGTIPGPTSR